MLALPVDALSSLALAAPIWVGTPLLELRPEALISALSPSCLLRPGPPVQPSEIPIADAEPDEVRLPLEVYCVQSARGGRLGFVQVCRTEAPCRWRSQERALAPGRRSQ